MSGSTCDDITKDCVPRVAEEKGSWATDDIVSGRITSRHIVIARWTDNSYVQLFYHRTFHWTFYFCVLNIANDSQKLAYGFIRFPRVCHQLGAVLVASTYVTVQKIWESLLHLNIGIQNQLGYCDENFLPKLGIKPMTLGSKAQCPIYSVTLCRSPIH